MEAAADCLSPAAREQAEARLAAKRAARAEAREIRMKELERQQKEIEERPEKDFEKGARTVSSLSAATLASLGGTSSRRGSGDTSISADTEASIREIKDIYELKDQIQDVEGKYMQGLKELKDSLAEVEEKYKKAMVSNAQLDNEKTNFMYQVDTLKDALLELEEQLAESRRQYEEKNKEFEREKHAHSILQFQFMEIKEALKQREEMLAKHGIIPDSEVATNGETSDIIDNEGRLDSSKTVPGTAQTLKTGGDGMLGKADEVDVKNEILEDMGKREILQNTEHEECKEETEEQEVQALHADENAKAEKMVEECDALPTAMLPDKFAEQIKSLTEPLSGSTSANDSNDTDDLRTETKSAGTAVQQPVSTEAEDHDLNAKTNQSSEVDSLQGHQIFETPQEMPSDLGTGHELEKPAPEQEEQKDFKTSHVPSDNDETDQEADIRSESCELVSNQGGLSEVTEADLPSDVVNVKSLGEGLQDSEENAENKVTRVLEEKVVESKDCTDGRIDKTGGDRAEEENEVGNTVQGQMRETESVHLEGTEPCESGDPAGTIEKESGGDQAHIQPVSSEDSPSASTEEQNKQDKTELENAKSEKDRKKKELTEELEMCLDSAETGEQDEASVEAVGCITELKGSVLQQAESDMGVVKEVITREASSDPSLPDDKINDSELEAGDKSGKGEDSGIEWVEDQTIQCSEETAGDTVGEKSTGLETEMQNVVKQEGEPEKKSNVDVSVTTENKVDETLKGNLQELELADCHGVGFASVEDANNSLAQEVEQGENVSEQVKLEGPAEESPEDDGDSFDFDEESNQILVSDAKCDEEKDDTQKEECDRANDAVGKTAQTDEAGERTDKIETKDAFIEDDSWQRKTGDKPEETGCLQGEASWKTDEKTDVMEDELKASDPNEEKKITDENVSEQDLESAGNNRDQSKEDLQGSRRGKGKSRDDCAIS
ncbi:leucine-rich repeat flightless-interacting protein 1 isoform X2 [Colius striatus]|uniref:leucine-rich repeat flightless-interacting protein 1 isoform X2 n=1 Tax=Colius striatus TaxID=57412 RepID=UPI002B1D0856|nr:leucine-rich repeat flightless-interacting protein 1 isoform X2 [Colius striatus]